MLDPGQAVQVVGTALALGLLVGLQRERTPNRQAGIRTFAIITVLGAILGILSAATGWWLAGAAILVIGGLMMVSHADRVRRDPANAGLTTEVAALLMFAVGILCAVGPLVLAVVVGGGMTVLLELKKPLHEHAAAISGRDFTAIMRFVLISLVILPVLPNQNYGPYQVLNPRETWIMVVLIVGISLGGYVLLKLFGEKAGTFLGGLLGGLVSSTATTVSYARQAAATPGIVGLAAMVVMLASAVAIVRVIILAGAVAPNALGVMAPPLLTFCGIMSLLFVGSLLTAGKGTGQVAEHGNPAELRPALIFGALYAVITLAVAASKDLFGDSALYPVAVISGLTDLDAIALTSARMIDKGQLDPHLGWRLILVAAMSNLVFKGAAAALLGGRLLGWRVGLWFGLSLAGGGAVLWWWPV